MIQHLPGRCFDRNGGKFYVAGINEDRLRIGIRALVALFAILAEKGGI
jgi:hypothetical protein